jgi:hypothetical protein
VTSKKVRHKKLAAIGCYCLTWRRWTTNTVVEPEKRLSFIDDWRRYCCSWLKWRRGGATSVFIAPTGGVLRRKVNDVFLMWDMDWQCFHKRLCRHSLSTLEVQHLFKQIEFSYFTFDALNFLLTKSLIGPHSLFPNFSQSSIVDLGWGNLLFILVHTWQMYEHVIYMMNTPFEFGFFSSSFLHRRRCRDLQNNKNATTQSILSFLDLFLPLLDLLLSPSSSDGRFAVRGRPLC